MRIAILFLFVSLLSSQDAFAQKETVTVDTLITTDDQGRTVTKIIKRKMVVSGGAEDLDIETVIEGAGETKKLMFLKSGEGELDFEIYRNGDGEDNEIKIIRRGGGSAAPGDSNFLWVEDGGHEMEGSIEIMKMEMESKLLASKISEELEEDAKIGLENELDELLNKIFDMKQEKMEASHEKKVESLKKTQAELKERRENKASMIQNRKTELLKEKKKTLKW